jgi:23S rRNA (adenine2503-C2)-methyltransferase
MNLKTPLTGFAVAELEEACFKIGEQKYRAHQIMDWVYGTSRRTLRPRDKKGALSFEEMTNLSGETRRKIAEHFIITSSQVKKVFTSKDGTKKILVELADKSCVECVLMSELDRITLCISTQVGCPVKCRFCASGSKGLIRSLEVNEIVEEVLLSQWLLKPDGLRVNNIVIMGMGEPFLNYDNLVKALMIITEKWGFGIGKNRITVSTVGLPDKIAQFAKEKVATNLAISLHSPNDEVRRQIIPLANNVKVRELVEAAKKYNQDTGKDITFEYLMIEGLNTNEVFAMELASLIKDTGGKINLIAYNEIHPVRGADSKPDKTERNSILLQINNTSNGVKGLPYRAPSIETITRFQDVLRQAGFIAMLRKSKGNDISAACGQLVFTPSRCPANGIPINRDIGI